MLKVRLILFIGLFFLTQEPSSRADTGWVRRYNGPGNGSDQAGALAVDDSGNVYVTGESYGSGTGQDYATIKYAPNGDTLWVRRYNGPANGWDQASALALDDSGNVYVTGYSGTIKYSDNGDSLWFGVYGGIDLTIDASGNVYVTGNTATIKYLTDGDTAWVRSYGGSALAVDESGNVYVTRGSGTIKYSTSGDSLWFGVYGGIDLAADNSGNVYVTGSSGADYATIKYAPNGDTLWVRRYNSNEDYPSALGLDNAGNVYVTGVSGHTTCGGGDYDAPPTCWFVPQYYASIKYSPSGDFSWVRRYSGSATTLAVDDSGNVYVTGSGGGDYATIKYAPNGDALWLRRYNGTGNGYDAAGASAVDNDGNVYVTGGSWSETSYDYVTIKYNKFGCAARAGDANGDININLDDIIFKINYIFKGDVAPDPFCAGDANADGNLLLSDIVYLINFIFKSGQAPVKSNECCL